MFLLANLVHYWSAEQDQDLLGRVRQAARTGDVYSVEEVRGRLDHTGWRFADHRPLAGPQSLIVAQAA